MSSSWEKPIYLDFQDYKQFFVHRIKTSGDTLPDYVQAFLLVEAMLQEMTRIKHKKQPGRSYPRVSRQPVQP